MPAPNDARFTTGSVQSFDDSWRQLADRERYHFARGEPQHQVQFAFQNHWRVFRKVMAPIASGSALEAGCGRGSMGAFFAEAGFKTHLLDSSPEAIELARRNFAADGLAGEFIVGDALALPFDDNSLDVTVSIGLLEHFEDIRQPVSEQIRVLRPGGCFLGYVVPEHRYSVQTLGAPVNAALAMTKRLAGKSKAATSKTRLYRNGLKSTDFLEVLRDLGVAQSGAFGMFPLPLISHSPSFPFSTMSPVAEQRLIRLWRRVLAARPGCDDNSPDPLADTWVCPESWGLAYLVWAKK